MFAEFPELLTTRLNTNAGGAGDLAVGIAAALELGMDWLGQRRGGYQLVYRDHRNDFCKRLDALAGQLDMRFLIDLNIGDEGTVQEVVWDSAAFQSGLTAGALIQRGDGESYNARSIGDAIEAVWHGAALRLTVKAGSQSRPREVTVDCRAGHRFLHLEPLQGART